MIFLISWKTLGYVFFLFHIVDDSSETFSELINMNVSVNCFLEDVWAWIHSGELILDRNQFPVHILSMNSTRDNIFWLIWSYVRIISSTHRDPSVFMDWEWILLNFRANVPETSLHWISSFQSSDCTHYRQVWYETSSCFHLAFLIQNQKIETIFQLFVLFR